MIPRRIGALIGILGGVFIYGLAKSASWEAPALLSITWLIVIFWVFEVIPLMITALVPLILFPLFDVVSLREATAPYAHPVIYLFLGGFMIAYGLEKYGLHRRFALALLDKMGHSTTRVLLALIIASAGLSMWISNTATTIMLLPLTLSIVEMMEANRPGLSGVVSPVFLLAIAYAANIGGTMTPVGTPPNILLLGLMESSGIAPPDFAAWIVRVAPWTLFMLAFLFWMQRRMLGKDAAIDARSWQRLIRRQREELGPLTPSQRRVLAIFALTAVGWIFRPFLVRGLGLSGLHDAVIAMLGGILMFVVPRAEEKGEALLTEADISRLPWGILILFGGALSLAAALKKHGVFDMLGAGIAHAVPAGWLPLLIIGLAIFATEVMSNSALTSVLIPVLLSLPGMGTSLAWAATLGASCAFMMPVATPPNAVVFSAPGMRDLRVMMRQGWWMNLAAWASLAAWYYLVGG